MKSASSDGGLELFFSYGHDRNRLLVERIKRDLEKRGHHVWIDTSEIKAGDNWRDGILNVLDSVESYKKAFFSHAKMSSASYPVFDLGFDW